MEGKNPNNLLVNWECSAAGLVLPWKWLIFYCIRLTAAAQLQEPQDD